MLPGVEANSLAFGLVDGHFFVAGNLRGLLALNGCPVPAHLKSWWDQSLKKVPGRAFFLEGNH